MNKNTYTLKLNDTQLLKLKELVVCGLKTAENLGLEDEYTDVFLLVADQMDRYYDNNDVKD